MQKPVDSPAETVSWGFRPQKSIFIARKKKQKPCSYSVDIPLPVLPFHPLRAQESTQSLGE